jgi:hypothetical protein
MEEMEETVETVDMVRMVVIFVVVGDSDGKRWWGGAFYIQ